MLKAVCDGLPSSLEKEHGAGSQSNVIQLRVATSECLESRNEA